MRQNDGSVGVPDSQIFAQIDVLNAVYNNMNLQFELAGIGRLLPPVHYEELLHKEIILLDNLETGFGQIGAQFFF
jgi:hypothetical protein